MLNPARILITPYLNNRAFVHYGAPKGCELQASAPRIAQAEIASGRAMAGVVPVGGLKQIDNLVTYIGAFGIACTGPVDSVLFFSRKPFEQLDDTSKIILTGDSMTSVGLLYLLFSYRNGSGLPLPTLNAEGADGELAIGDRALKMKARGEYPYVLDLAEAWQLHHGLPMVFARWVIRKDAPRALRSRIHEWLIGYASRESDLLDLAANADAERAGLSPQYARTYLGRMRTALQSSDLQGQRIYEQDLALYNYFPMLDLAADTPLETQQVKR